MSASKSVILVKYSSLHLLSSVGRKRVSTVTFGRQAYAFFAASSIDGLNILWMSIPKHRQETHITRTVTTGGIALSPRSVLTEDRKAASHGLIDPSASGAS